MATNTLIYDSIQVGDEIPALTKGPIERMNMVRYSGAAGDFNPIHTVPEIANEAGLPEIIAHGMLMMGYAGQLLTDWLGPDTLRQFQVRFKGMGNLGDVLTCTGRVTEKYERDGEHFIEGKVSVKGQDDLPRLTGSFVAVVGS